MTPDRKHELWAVALWVEKEHGDNWWDFIHEQQEKLIANGEPDGALFWNEVIELCAQLRPQSDQTVQ
ncbi:MAG: hypothetical protein AAGI28_03535 [Pseudomonadota bacterium]